MQLITYPAVLDDSKSKDKGFYEVSFPDLDGVFSQGHGLSEALYNAEQALGLALEDVPKDKMPKPSSVEKITAICHKHYPKALVYPVVTDLDQARNETKPVMVRKNTSIPEDLAQDAEAAGINFSQTLREGLEKKLNKLGKE